MEINKLQKIINEGTTICSSGTTGKPKPIEQTVAKLKASDEAAIDSQQLTSKSKVYTVCKTTHAGGLLAQSLPAIRLGAEVVFDDFNPYRWVKEVHKYTHTHIIPAHGEAIMKTKGFKDMDLSNVWITCGSDIVPWYLIKAFVNRGATFMCNWGMTEVGHCAINTVFGSLGKIEEYKSKVDPTGSMPILGDRFYCDYQISEWNELSVKGDICVYDDWFKTGDLVEEHKSVLFYNGRK